MAECSTSGKKRKLSPFEPDNAAGQSEQGDIHLYPVSIRIPNEVLPIEVKLHTGNCIKDLRQILLNSPKTCFFTCYRLLLVTRKYELVLEDSDKIAEVANVAKTTIGGCSLKLVPADYNDRSIKAHVHHTRKLLSLSTLPLSLSTSLESTTDTVQTEVPELDSLGFMKDFDGSLNKLLSSPSKKMKCVESIVFSSFNPPESCRKIHGDLIYLDVVTLEGYTFCITGTTQYFYVNSSSRNDTFDHRPYELFKEAPTLVEILQAISSKFKKAFHEIMEMRASSDLFEHVHSLSPPYSWLGLHPVPDHKRDAARAEDALAFSYGSELSGMQRDWNEELQSCREFPLTSPQERIVRDRALYKVTSDFVDAAISGASRVISGCILPINPAEPERFHIFVHNNILFSFAVDEDFELLSRNRTPDSISKMESTREIAIDEDFELATYASANNNLKGTKAYQEADVPGLYNPAMAIIDYRGHRLIAQTVIAGILVGDRSDSVLYGSVNGKKIYWNEGSHRKMLEAANRLHMKEHTVLDESGNVFKLAAAVECKVVVGTDDRHYLLDLMRITPRDANYMGYGSRFCILRPELISSYCQNTSGAEENAPLLAENSFNPNVFSKFKLAGSAEEMARDEEHVRNASIYLTEVVLPKFIQDLCKHEVSPMDGETLTEALHARGINVRYVGKVADGTRNSPHLWDLCSNEIVVRSAKHILKGVLRNTEDHEIARAIRRFFNCLFGDHQGHPRKKSKRQERWKSEPSTDENVFSYKNVSSKTLWSDIQEFAKLKYKFGLPKDARTRVKKFPFVRNLCQKVGITIAGREYDLNSAKPFERSDILGIQTVVKHSVPVSSEAKNLMEIGKIQFAKGMFSEAKTSFSEAFSILQQVTGPMHREVAKCCRNWTKALLFEGREIPRAIMLKQKELIINERCLGLDHPDTAHCYETMALIHGELKQTKIAQQYWSRALLLLRLSSVPDHPVVERAFGHVSSLYQNLGKDRIAMQYLLEARKIKERRKREEFFVNQLSQ